MKRRVEEVFNPRPGGGLSTAASSAAAALASAQNARVLSAQNATQASTIQYQVNPGVLKVTSVVATGPPGNNNNNNNNSGASSNNISNVNVTNIGGGTLGNSTVEVINSCPPTIIGGGQQNNQTTTQPQFGTYPNSITVSNAANLLARTPGTQIIGGGQQQQVHVVNATQNLIRHKTGGGTTVTVAQPPTVIGGNGTSIVTLPVQQQVQSSQVTILGGGGVAQQQPPTNLINVTTPGGGGGLSSMINASGGPPTTPTSNGSGQFQRLKVEDALVYLDNVKSKFGNQPQVYNDFLDIMKEFKSQSIDTPGVIERVSTLFKGHPDLIVGFNTFLPPGYKIEIQANDTGYSYQVSVSMPDRSTTSCPVVSSQQQSPSPKLQIIQGSGTLVTTTQTTGPVNLVAHPPNATVTPGGGGGNTISVQSVVNALAGGVGGNINNNAVINLQNNGNATISSSPGANSFLIRGNAEKERNSAALAMSMNLTTAAAIRSNTTDDHQTASSNHNLQHVSQAHQVIQAQQQLDTSGSLDGQGANQNQPVEFQSAISYVNKIKKRFQNEPDKYKRFLEILHQYQKEQKTVRGDNSQQKPLTEQEVYSQVAILFDKNEDLLKEFGKFLPDAANHSSLQGLNKSGSFGSVGSHGSGGGGMDKKQLDGSVVGLSAGGRGANTSGGSGNNRYSGGSAGGYSRQDHRAGGNGGGGQGGGGGGPLSNIGNLGGGGGGMGIGGGGVNDFGHHFDYKDQYHHLSGVGGGGAGRDKDRAGMPKYSQVKRSPSFGNSLTGGINRNSGGLIMDRGGDAGGGGPPPSKKHKSVFRDVTLAEAAKYGTLNEFAFFDKVRRALRNAEVYDNFLRCLILFNQEIITKPELLNLTAPFLVKHPELHKWFQDFLGPMDGGGQSLHGATFGIAARDSSAAAAQQRQQDRAQEHSQEIDLSTCKRLGASYCALPKTSELRKCSGRTALCREVLNDMWVSFPTWAEDSTFVTSRKTQYEELIYRCEDERFELDVIIETNSATIRVLEGVHKKMSRMSVEELMRFNLDDCLGGSSPTIHQRALRRIYGEKAADIIQGLKRNPSVAVPVVLRRLKAKEEEWREAQKGFNKQWRDQNEKYYLKSLDHQGINFKQTDTKALRSKSLFNDIETLYDERHEHNEDHSQEQVVSGPHLVLPYKDKTILEDATNLLIHHVKRQTGIQKQEKSKIKHILRQFVPDLFFSPRQQLSDDEREESNSDGTEGGSGGGGGKERETTKEKGQATSSYLPVGEIKEEDLTAEQTRRKSVVDDDVDMMEVGDSGKEKAGGERVKETSPEVSEIKKEPADCDVTPAAAALKNMEEEYTLFFANNNWYLFLRLHAILCERLRTMYDRSQILAAEEAQYKSHRRESTATALRLKSRSEIQVEDYYPTFLDMLKNVLDGNLDGNNFEDSLREMFGIHAYIAFTLDRVVQNAVRQLQHCVTERLALDCVALFTQEQKLGGAGGPCRVASKRTAAELAYQRKAEQKLQDENCFKVYIYKLECRVTVELLDTESDDTEKSVSYAQEWSTYVERYTNQGTTSGQNNGPGGGGPGRLGYSDNKGGGSSGSSVMDTSTSGDGPSKVTSKSSQRDGGGGGEGGHQPQGKKSKGSSSEAGAASGRDNEDADKEGGKQRRPLFLRRNIRNRGNLNRPEVASIGPNGMIGPESDSPAERIADKERPTTTTTKEQDNGGQQHQQQPADNNPTTTAAEVKLNMNSYKLICITNKHGLFYKRNSISRARKHHEVITKRLKARFSKFTDKWAAKNVNKAQETQCLDWMLGKVVLENTSVVTPVSAGSSTTVVCKENDIARTPYFLYNRYKVLKGSSGNSSR